MDNNKPQISTESPRGAVLYTDYVGRRMKAYAVTEPELRHISFLNSLSTAAFSAASFCAALACGILTSGAFVQRNQMPPEGVVLMASVPYLFAATIVLILLGGYALWSRHSEWAQIKRESDTRPPEPQSPQASIHGQ